VSYIDNNSGLFQLNCALADRNLLTGFEEILNIQIYGLTEVCEGLFVGMASGVATLEGGTRGVPSITAILKLVRFDHYLEDIGFHSGLLKTRIAQEARSL